MPPWGTPKPLIEIGSSSKSNASGMNNRKYPNETVSPKPKPSRYACVIRRSWTATDHASTWTQRSAVTTIAADRINQFENAARNEPRRGDSQGLPSEA